MIILNRIIEALLLPPGLTLLLLLVGLLLLGRHRRWGVGLIAMGGVALYLASIPVVADRLVHSLEQHPALSEQQIMQSGAQAIVILGSGRYPMAPEYGGRDTVSVGALTRIRYGAWVHRVSGLPVLVSGGSPYGEEEPEAALMKQALEQEFSTPVRWAETKSRSTGENALFSAALLDAAGVKRILLVTDAFHMQRALFSFAKTDLEVVPAPTLFRVRSHEESFSDWLPVSNCASHTALHEYLGLAWYWLLNLVSVKS